MISQNSITGFYITASEITSIECAICLDLIKEERAEHENGGELHPFHVDCIKESLKYKKECPNCRKNIITLWTLPLFDVKTFCISLIGAIAGIAIAAIASLDFEKGLKTAILLPYNVDILLGLINGFLCSDLADNRIAFIIAGLVAGYVRWTHLSL